MKSLLAAALIALTLPAFAQSNLPPGPGKETVETACIACHDLKRVTNNGYSEQDWRTVIAMMVNVGAPVKPDQTDTLVHYLAANFPARPRPSAVLLSGETKVEIKEWTVPTPGSRPHDPLAGPDGSLWYSGQMANVLGRLDPATGQFKEFHLPDGTGPHGLIFDKDGKIWFTANFGGYIGKLDPATGTVTRYPLPDPTAHDPHTLVFDQKGILWFTVQSADKVGRLDPATGAIKLVTVATPRANPYGMVVTSEGVPFFDEFGTNKIGRIDPATMAIRDYALPNPGARPRRIAITSDDIIWYTDYARGYLGRLYPVTGAVIEWPSPGGRDSQPYAIAVAKDAIWYVETGTSPNTLVRFDPLTQKFQTWPIPSGGGVVRNMMPTRDGNLALACSGVDRVALAEIK
jgi:virginiamycin B lyase